MSWRRSLVVRVGWFLAAGGAIVALWSAYERGVVGRAYRCTAWRELALARPPTDDGRPIELGPEARSLVGSAVFLVAQKGDWLGNESTDQLVPTIHMPRRDDYDAATPDVGVKTNDAQRFQGTDDWGMVRIWGRLRRTVADDAVPGRYASEVPLELVVDRVEEDPPFLPLAIAPTTTRGWIGWATAGGLMAVAVGPALRLARRLWRVRLVAGAVLVGSSLIALAAAVALLVPGLDGVDCYDGRAWVHAAASRREIAVRWDGDYSGYAIPGISGYRDKSGPTESAGRLGLRLRSYYTRYDWGNVHAHVELSVSPLWLVLAFGSLAWLALRRYRRPRVTPGRCVKCGYDLRATRTTCPECGRHVTA